MWGIEENPGFGRDFILMKLNGESKGFYETSGGTHECQKLRS